MKIITKSAYFTLFSILTGCTQAHHPHHEASRPLASFPSRAELAAAPEKPLPESVFVDHATRVERWDIDPASLPAADAKPDARMVGAIQSLFGDKTTASPALVCAARELGQLQLTKGGAPTEGMRRYMAGRCGATLPSVTYASREFPVPEKVSDKQLWQEVIEKPKKKAPNSEVAMQAGVAIVRLKDRAVVSMVVGRTTAALEPLAPVKAGVNEVLLRGAVSGPSELVYGIINQGAHGFAPCVPAEPVEPPRFSLRCPMAEGDESAWVDVMSRAPQKIMSRAVLSVMARREGAKAPYVSAVTEIHPTGNFAKDLLAHLNAARVRGQLAPLALSTEQSAINQRLAGSILGADEGDNAERLTLGLMAGWEVQGMVRRGDLLTLIASSTAEPGAWLTEALDQPISRSILLQPDRRVVAIGAASPSPQLGVGAVISTYALFEGNDHEAEVIQVLRQLNKARSKRGLRPVKLAAELFPMKAAASRIFQGKQGASEAISEGLDESSQQSGTSLQAAYFEAIDLEALDFPAALETTPHSRVSITVTHYRPAGAAWGQYVIVIVPLPRVNEESAQLDLPHRG